MLVNLLLIAVGVFFLWAMFLAFEDGASFMGTVFLLMGLHFLILGVTHERYYPPALTSGLFLGWSGPVELPQPDEVVVDPEKPGGHYRWWWKDSLNIRPTQVYDFPVVHIEDKKTTILIGNKKYRIIQCKGCDSAEIPMSLPPYVLDRGIHHQRPFYVWRWYPHESIERGTLIKYMPAAG